ncbi:MAG: N-acetylneuraminate synthase family protein [archaeon]
MQNIRIGSREIGQGQPCYVIAEAGINHNGRLDLAKRLIDVAVEAGADSVKFQMFKTGKLLSKKVVEGQHIRLEGGEDSSVFDAIKKVEFTQEMCREAFDYAKKKGITLFASACDAESIEFLESIGVKALKIASCDITNIPLLRRFAKTGKPLILSTGMSDLKEVKEAVNVLKQNGAKEIALLHCLAQYPAKVEESNLRAIEAMEKEFGVPAGFSDHSAGTFIAPVAVAAGAKLFEKHFTLDKDMWGFDHKASANPEELKKIVEDIRLAEKALGTGEKKPTNGEEELKKAMRRSITANQDIAKGTVLQEKMLAIKRPGTGLPSKRLPEVVGKKAKKGIKEDELISLEDLE